MINADKVLQWKKDIEVSVDFYNEWFINFAPKAYRDTRAHTAKAVLESLEELNDLTEITPQKLLQNPEAIAILRMCTIPPLARDRLTGLGHLNRSFLSTVEETGGCPPKMKKAAVYANLEAIAAVIQKLIDFDIFPWLRNGSAPTEKELFRASSVVADRLCGAMANPIIRNAQEQRQLARIEEFLSQKGYQKVADRHISIEKMAQGTFTFRFNVKANLTDAPIGDTVNIPVDVVIKRKNAPQAATPVFIECKSAGDFTNTNKRRKEEAIKAAQLRNTFGKDCTLYLFLCGYFDSGYLGYEAAEGIDWVWEHRIGDLELLGI